MTMIQTGKISLSSDNAVETAGGNTSTFTRVTFPTPFPAGSEVIVLPLTQTFNGPDTPGIRVHNVNEQGFLIRLNEVRVNASVVSDGKHTTEQVGWLATTV
ncbi:hypothetical protein [Streptomyces albipurpureus]|uniref:H-type lectin domain-containing protein n=1 Tax=Streptomyces albipurpureus TaxID=2897419 RepID=A0ABT0UTS8_9ACTN|nr:hypothetical protein [Streptomyces sp. CWNU-1]MCM2390758.1 hypothetical protein [Streptomyces sp. CWNU-1]